MKTNALTLAALVIGGCADDPLGTDVCADAEAHVAACTGTSGLVGADCDEDNAGSLLETPCEDLSAGGIAKADFWSSGSPLCVLLIGATDLADETVCCFDYNCSEGSVCLDYRCTPQPQAGDACSRDTHCTDGFVCGPDQACQARVASGEACDRDPICAEGLLCVDDQCAPPRAAGEACEPRARDCEADLFCDAGTCGDPHGADGACELDRHCTGDLICAAGRCGGRSELGGGCDVGEMDCSISLHCVDSVCVNQPGGGEACEREPFWMCGHAKICWEGACAPEHTAGEPCISALDCAGHSLCIDGVCEPA